MAGMMHGSKGMASARMSKDSPKKSAEKSPRSVHIKEAEGGYVLQKRGGESAHEPFMGFGKDHVAADFDAAMAAAHAHLGNPKSSLMKGKIDEEDPEHEKTESKSKEESESEKPEAKVREKKSGGSKIRVSSESY